MVVDAFRDDTSRSYVEKYIEELVTNWRATMQRVGRVTWLSGILMVLFFLLGSGNVAELGIAGLKFDHDGLVLVTKFIPPVVAFLVAELWLLARSTDVLVEVHESLVRTVLVSNIDPAAIEPIKPFGLTQFGLSGMLIREDAPGRGRANGWLLWTGVFNLIAVLFAPLAFLVYAYISLFSQFGPADPLVWIGLVLTVVNACNVVAALNIQ
jgi:hypothetical protein